MERGLVYPYEKPDNKIGFSAVVLTDDTKELIKKKFFLKKDVFSIARSVPENAKKSPKSYKLVCPVCDLKVRATKPDLQIKCMDCDEQLEEE
jgi:hypothetical protein